MASGAGGAALLDRVRGRIALECPQSPLNVRGDAGAFLVDRHALREQHLAVLEQVFQLVRHLVQLRERNSRLNVILDKLLQHLPFGRARGPGGAVDELARFGQGKVNAAFCLVPLCHVGVQGVGLFFCLQGSPRRGFHFHA